MPFLSVETKMKWINKILLAIVVTLVVVASVVLAILNPQMMTINLWGWLTVECSVVEWSLLMLAVGLVLGVGLACVLIIKLQSQLYASKRRLSQLQETTVSHQESSK